MVSARIMGRAGASACGASACGSDAVDGAPLLIFLALEAPNGRAASNCMKLASTASLAPCIRASFWRSHGPESAEATTSSAAVSRVRMAKSVLAPWLMRTMHISSSEYRLVIFPRVSKGEAGRGTGIMRLNGPADAKTLRKSKPPDVVNPGPDARSGFLPSISRRVSSSVMSHTAESAPMDLKLWASLPEVKLSFHLPVGTRCCLMISSPWF
mmetsp:Transcript_39461/g.76708  ORF Transcript_39461/g.76708 Transcript_39461/m.76708 type:complete len:212 (+) Transcript_39461:955-1590(+)